MAHGGKVKDPRWLNKRAREFLDEFHQTREQLHTPMSHAGAAARTWQPPLHPALKLNFDAAIFSDLKLLRCWGNYTQRKGRCNGFDVRKRSTR